MRRALGVDLRSAFQNQIYLKIPMKVWRSVQNFHQKQAKSTNIIMGDPFKFVFHKINVSQERKFVTFFLQLCGSGGGRDMLPWNHHPKDPSTQRTA
jgi:hypothetical protein